MQSTKTNDKCQWQRQVEQQKAVWIKAFWARTREASDANDFSQKQTQQHATMMTTRDFRPRNDNKYLSEEQWAEQQEDNKSDNWKSS